MTLRCFLVPKLGRYLLMGSIFTRPKQPEQSYQDDPQFMCVVDILALRDVQVHVSGASSSLHEKS